MFYLRFIFILFIFSCASTPEAKKQNLINQIILGNTSYADSSQESFINKIGKIGIFPDSLKSITNRFIADTKDNKRKVFQTNLERLNVIELEEIIETQKEVKKYNKPLKMDESMMGVLGTIFTSNPFPKEKQAAIATYLKNSKKSEMLEKVMNTSSVGAFSSILPKEITSGILGKFSPFIQKANEKRRMAMIYNQFKDVPVEKIERLNKLVSRKSYSHLINSEVQVIDNYPKLFNSFFKEVKKIAPDYLKTLKNLTL